MESFATGLKRIYAACKKVGCRVQFVQQMYGFVVIFYRGNRTQNSTQDSTQDNTQDKILKYCIIARSKKEITEYMGYKDVKSFSKRYINPLCESGQLQMTIPEHPTSRNQKYITVT